MRYRKLDQNDDYQFGHSLADFWYNQPEAVGQAILTRLRLYRGEWFLDLTVGTPWGGFPLNDEVVARGQILAERTQQTRDLALKRVVLETQGVSGIAAYSSSFDPNIREFRVSIEVDTIYGAVALAGLVTMEGVFALGISPLDGTVGLG
jgi:hypothetical protein